MLRLPRVVPVPRRESADDLAMPAQVGPQHAPCGECPPSQRHVQWCRPQFAELRRGTQQIWCSREALEAACLDLAHGYSIAASSIRTFKFLRKATNSAEISYFVGFFFLRVACPPPSSFSPFFPSGLEGFVVTRARGLPYCAFPSSYSSSESLSLPYPRHGHGTGKPETPSCGRDGLGSRPHWQLNFRSNASGPI